MGDAFIGALSWVNIGALVYFLATNTLYAVLLLSALWTAVNHVLRVRGESRWLLLGSHATPSISVIAPAFNEQITVVESVRGLLALNYPNLEIIVVNDGSSDDTLRTLSDEFDLTPIHLMRHSVVPTKPVKALYQSRSHPRLVVADKENGGKADALNAGLNLATSDLVCAIDADTIIEQDALQRMARPFLTGDDVLAAGGTIRVLNGCEVRKGRVTAFHLPKSPLAGIQVVEYLRAFLFGRLGWNLLGGNLIISGAFGLFRRDAVMEAGGYERDSVGEDMELVLRLRRRGYESGTPHRVEFIPDPVAWTEVPESLSSLGKQRDRWHRGLSDVLWRNRRVFFNRKYGALGCFVFPYYVFGELLAPVIELIGLPILGLAVVLGAVEPEFAVLFFAVAYGYAFILNALTLGLDELVFHRYGGPTDRLILLGWSFLEALGYRQLTAVWRLRGIYRFFTGNKDWGAMERRGVGAAKEQAASGA